ncbi:hypothetical protein DRW07_13790 [Alteromonas sediminis]|uniref:DUF3887 domain-containing protein n=1 Tax=Alteromonas sediminis TaxID=2259342 RepID=A0A3N5Z9G6_9ALTE|nr:hypothetical protein [Alteromonas sediminis]RPJ65878.1 hypothetical protein DRW07_13790 [Alteromonas sediminis]
MPTISKSLFLFITLFSISFCAFSCPNDKVRFDEFLKNAPQYRVDLLHPIIQKSTVCVTDVEKSRESVDINSIREFMHKEIVKFDPDGNVEVQVEKILEKASKKYPLNFGPSYRGEILLLYFDKERQLNVHFNLSRSINQSYGNIL